MNKTFIRLLTLALLTGAATTSAIAGPKEDHQVRQASAIINRFKMMPEQEIPYEVLRGAKGVAIVTVTKGGFIWSAKGGSGVVLARTGRGWSGPSFIRTGGFGFGAQVGGQVTEYVFILNTPEAVRAFSNNSNIQLGGSLSVAAGPVGRSADAGVLPKAAVYSYSRSQGLFAGVSLEGSMIGTDHKANQRFYQRPVASTSILSGQVRPPSRSPVVALNGL